MSGMGTTDRSWTAKHHKGDAERAPCASLLKYREQDCNCGAYQPHAKALASRAPSAPPSDEDAARWERIVGYAERYGGIGGTPIPSVDDVLNDVTMERIAMRERAAAAPAPTSGMTPEHVKWIRTEGQCRLDGNPNSASAPFLLEAADYIEWAIAIDKALPDENDADRAAAPAPRLDVPSVTDEEVNAALGEYWLDAEDDREDYAPHAITAMRRALERFATRRARREQRP